MHAHSYQRHRPEQTLFYKLVEEHYPAFAERMACEGRALPDYVRREFDEFLCCGLLEHGFLRVRCDSCHAERLVAFSCKRRGFCPSCGARRMAEAAALLVDEVFPDQPVRQWVLSLPYPLRFLFASRPEVMGHVDPDFIPIRHNRYAQPFPAGSGAALTHQLGLAQPVRVSLYGFEVTNITDASAPDC